MKRKSIFLILSLTGLSNIGMNFHHPITPTLFTDLNLPSYIFGTSFAVMCLFSFLSSMYWGDKINSIGRVKVFAICTFAYGIGQFFLLIAPNEMFIYFGRAISGIFASGAAVSALTYLLDIVSVEKRGHYIAISTAIITVCSTIGFLFGGILGEFHYKYSLIFQVIWMFVLAILSLLLLEETNNKDNYNTSSSFNPFMARHHMTFSLAIILFIVFFANFASSSYDNSFNYYLKAVLDLTPIANGVFKFIFGIVGLIANMTLNIWIVKKTNINVSLTIVLVLCALFAFGSLYFEGIIPFIIFNIIFFGFNSVYLSLLQTISLNSKSTDEISIISGIINSFKSLGMVCGATVAGFVFDIDADLPFIISICMFIIAAIFTLTTIRKKEQSN